VLRNYSRPLFSIDCCLAMTSAGCGKLGNRATAVARRARQFKPVAPRDIFILYIKKFLIYWFKYPLQRYYIHVAFAKQCATIFEKAFGVLGSRSCKSLMKFTYRLLEFFYLRNNQIKMFRFQNFALTKFKIIRQFFKHLIFI